MSCDFFFRGTLQMTRDLCIFLLFSLCRWHGSLRFLGMSDNSHVICRYYIYIHIIWIYLWISQSYVHLAFFHMYNFCIIHIEHLHIYLYTIPYLCNIEAPPKGSTPPLWFSWTSCASFASSSWAKMAKRGRSWEVYLPYKLYIVRKYTSIQYDDDSKINYHHCFMIIAMIYY